MFTLRRTEIARFIEDVVVGQQHFALLENNLPALHQRGVVQHALTGLNVSASHVATY